MTRRMNRSDDVPVCRFGPGGDFVEDWPAAGVGQASEEGSVLEIIGRGFRELVRGLLSGGEKGGGYGLGPVKRPAYATVTVKGATDARLSEQVRFARVRGWESPEGAERRRGLATDYAGRQRERDLSCLNRLSGQPMLFDDVDKSVHLRLVRSRGLSGARREEMQTERPERQALLFEP